MKRRLLHALVVGVMVVAGATVVAAPASASNAPGAICVLNKNTWLRVAPGGPVLLTLSAGRGFRWHGYGVGDETESWIYGHGAEAPSVDGWIPAQNASNCYWP